MEPIPHFMSILLVYYISINLISLLIMLVDKRRAIYHQWRISEASLLLLALFGGALGMLVGMIVFHHKTQKLKFAVGIPILLIIQFLLLCYYNTLIT